MRKKTNHVQGVAERAIQSILFDVGIRLTKKDVNHCAETLTNAFASMSIAILENPKEFSGLIFGENGELHEDFPNLVISCLVSSASKVQEKYNQK